MNWYTITKHAGRFQSVGTLRYPEEGKAILEIDQDICSYYRSMVPKHEPNPKSSMFPCHITAIRIGKEIVVDQEAWAKHDGEQVPFEYENEVGFDGTSYFLRAYSPRLEEIRQELGMSPIREGKSEFHITIGNVK